MTMRMNTKSAIRAVSVTDAGARTLLAAAAKWKRRDPSAAMMSLLKSRHQHEHTAGRSGRGGGGGGPRRHFSSSPSTTSRPADKNPPSSATISITKQKTTSFPTPPPQQQQHNDITTPPPPPPPPRLHPRFATLTPTQHASHLAHQRLSRPLSPHLSIYRPQIHSVASALQRNTGLLLAGPLYLFGISYSLSSLLPIVVTDGGWVASDVTTATVSMAAALGGVGGGALGLLLKAGVGWAGVFHGVNGVLGLSRGTWPKVMVGEKGRFVRVGWLVLGASAVGSAVMVGWEWF